MFIHDGFNVSLRHLFPPRPLLPFSNVVLLNRQALFQLLLVQGLEILLHLVEAGSLHGLVDDVPNALDPDELANLNDDVPWVFLELLKRDPQYVPGPLAPLPPPTPMPIPEAAGLDLALDEELAEKMREGSPVHERRYVPGVVPHAHCSVCGVTADDDYLGAFGGGRLLRC